MSSWFNSASSWTKGNCLYIFPHLVIWFWENSDVVNGKIVSKCQLTHFRTKHQRDALWAVHHYLTQRCFLFLIQSIRTKYKLFLKWLKSVATPPPSIPQNNIFIISWYNNFIWHIYYEQKIFSYIFKYTIYVYE